MELGLIQRFADVNGKRVLEVGSGDGRLTRQFARLATKVVAVEPDRAGVSVARREFAAEGMTNVLFRVGSIERTRLGGGKFDLALFSWSL